MTHPIKALLLIASLGLAACTSPDRFGGGNSVDLNNSGGLNDPNAMGAGDATSPSYFSSTIGDRVLFAVDESTLSPEARQILTGQASWLNQNTAYAILVEGHADEQGTREYNLALSAKRASAVQQFLVAQGIAGNRIRTVPYGKERPLEICSEESCYAKNRRAVTVLQAGGTS
ncbi:MAG: peptidoglycan-associated lipoprotein Pal [Rhodobacter sp.]|nr:peptidoglycan-associated lipoprotein Pal [Rhodobacter sp.]